MVFFSPPVSFTLTPAIQFACSVYSTLLLLWPVEELADEPSGDGEVARGECLFAWNFSVTRSTVLTKAERRH